MTAGEKIGPYEVTGFLGAGAMGEVHRARDPRLGREVAIKTLPASLGAEPERVKRFDLEVRAAGSLNHPNILTVYDVGTFEGVPYLVSELLEGDTLRARLKDGPLPLRRALELGAQAANGLAAAHARGIVHRDLKPENLFVTTQGSLKILDFGLAKLVEKNGGSPLDGDSLAGTMTAAGVFMGTVGYIAPEQARGLQATAASDVFALGCVLYEMVTGTRAFHKDSPLDTMMAILNEDTVPLPARVRNEAPGLDAILRRCLEKQPADRFESTRDLAFALSQAVPGVVAAPAESGPPQAKLDSRVSFHRLTFRRGSVLRARFTPDGNAVVYGGAWEGQPVETFWMPLGNPDGRPIGHPGTDVLSVAKNGELALSVKRRSSGSFGTMGTLARAPMGGGAPRQLMQNVEEADWHPASAQLAVVRTVEGRGRLEFPIGKVLFETTGWISHPRFSRDGKQIAFLHHPYWGNDLGNVTVVDLEGRARLLSDGWGTIRGLAWSADGSEVWFCGHRQNGGRGLQAVDLEGRAAHAPPGAGPAHDPGRAARRPGAPDALDGTAGGDDPHGGGTGGARPVVARLVAAARHLAGRRVAPDHRERRGGRRIRLDLHPADRRVAGDPARQRQRDPLLAGRDVDPVLSRDGPVERDPAPAHGRGRDAADRHRDAGLPGRQVVSGRQEPPAPRVGRRGPAAAAPLRSRDRARDAVRPGRDRGPRLRAFAGRPPRRRAHGHAADDALPGRRRGRRCRSPG